MVGGVVQCLGWGAVLRDGATIAAEFLDAMITELADQEVAIVIETDSVGIVELTWSIPCSPKTVINSGDCCRRRRPGFDGCKHRRSRDDCFHRWRSTVGD